MNWFIACIIVILGVTPSVALGKSLCIQFNNASVMVIKGLGKGSKPVSVYLADWQTGEDYDFRPMSGSALLSSTGQLVAGFTEYGVVMTSATGNSADGTTIFHRLRCSPGSDEKLGVLDSCSSNTWILPSETLFTHNGHVIDCIPQVAIP